MSLRLLFFVVPFGLIYWLGLQLQFSLALSGGVAAVLAALISLSLSVIFLSRPRAVAAQSIVDWRNRDRTVDDIEEDDALDGDAPAQSDAPAPVDAPDSDEVAAEDAAPAASAPVADSDAAPRN